MARRLVLAHVFGRYLPVSEVFLHELLGSLGTFDHLVLASRPENLDRFPAPRLVVPDRPEAYWEAARDAKADLVVSHFGPLGATGLGIAQMIDRPAVTMFYGYDQSTVLREPHWVERYRALAAHGMHAICNSDFGRRRLMAIGWPAAQVTAIHLGVDTARFRFAPRDLTGAGASHPLRLLMVARLVPKKGIGVAMRAVKRLRDSGVDALLRIVGEGSERDALEAVARNLDLGAGLALLGARTHAEVARELREAHVYLQCSVTAPDGDQEGLPVALTEAQAAGLPVVASRHAGIPELVLDGETGLLVEEHDDEALATALRRLVAEPDLADRFVRAGRRHVEREFDLAGQAARFAARFEQIATAPRPAARRAPGGPVKRLLFLRTVPVDQALRRLAVLRFRYPGARVTVLTSQSTGALFSSAPMVDDVITYADGPLRLRHLGLERLRSIQSSAFDLVVAPSTRDDGSGFGNVRRAARACGGRRRVVMSPADVERPMPGAVRPVLTDPAPLERTA